MSYDVVLLVERALSETDAVQVRSLHEGVEEGPVRYHVLVPLEDAASEPMSFEFSMGVRKGERELKTQLEEVLDRRQAEIRKIFEEYGVPLLPLKPAGEAAERTPPSPGSHKHESSRQ